MVRMRAFIAVDLVNKEVKKEVANLQQNIKRSEADLKLVEVDNLHFTLRFLGEIAEKEYEAIRDLLKEIEFPLFKISYKGIGVFPNERKISVIWIGVEKGSEELIKLSMEVENKLTRLNFRPEKRFIPHLTIARVKSGRNKEELIKSVQKYSEKIFGEDTVSSILIKRSTLTPKGPIYDDIFTLPFKEK